VLHVDGDLHVDVATRATVATPWAVDGAAPSRGRPVLDTAVTSNR
jgi:hypothetical protein